MSKSKNNKKTLSLANYIIEKIDARHMKIQKLMYFSCGWYLALQDKWLIEKDVKFQAWPYGPVIPVVYGHLKKYGKDIVSKRILEGEYEEPKEEKRTIIDTVIEQYNSFTDWELSAITHKKGSPWDITIENGEIDIDIELMKNHFQSLA